METSADESNVESCTRYTNVKQATAGGYSSQNSEPLPAVFSRPRHCSIFQISVAYVFKLWQCFSSLFGFRSI
jgi:hypothetical protein